MTPVSLDVHIEKKLDLKFPDVRGEGQLGLECSGFRIGKTVSSETSGVRVGKTVLLECPGVRIGQKLRLECSDVRVGQQSGPETVLCSLRSHGWRVGRAYRNNETSPETIRDRRRRSAKSRTAGALDRVTAMARSSGVQLTCAPEDLTMALQSCISSSRRLANCSGLSFSGSTPRSAYFCFTSGSANTASVAL